MCYSRKNRNKGDLLFWTLLKFSFCTFNLGNSGAFHSISHYPRTFGKIVLHNLEISGPKTRTPGILCGFSWTPLEIFFFLIDHWNFHKLFLQYPLITASLWSFNFKFLVDIEKVLNFGRKTRHCVCYIFPNSDLVLIFSDYLSLIKSFRNSWSGNCKEQIRINSACKCCNIFWKYNAGKILKLSSGEIANYIATPSYI